MAEAIVGPVLSKLQEVAVKEGKALAGVGDEIDRLRERLMWLHALVYETDLRTRSEGNQLIRVLASQMREIAFEAEDAVDHFVLKVDLSRFGRHWHRAARLFFANFGTQIYVRYMLSQKIKAMNMRLEDIHDNNAKYSGNNNETTAAAVTWRASRYIPPVRHNWDDSHFEELKKPKGKKTTPTKGNRKGTEAAKPKKTPNKSGKASAEEEKSEKEKEQAAELAQDDLSTKKETQEGKSARKEKIAELQKELQKEGSFVIYVVGESGIGKRHLIRKAFKDETITENFDVCIWASFPPDTCDIADQIKRKLKEKCSKLQPAGKKKLYQVKYFVVLDCPMSSAMLGKIIEHFPQGAAGSKIVVTATSSPSPPAEKTGGVIKLGYLDKAKSRKLFNNTIGLGGRRKSAYKTEMMDMVRDHIEEITNCLPLAVILVAKLMRSMNYNKWEDASKYIMNNNQDDLLKTIVSMGIDDLPDELKSCLLYMAAGFPERSTMDAAQLVRLWKAEGFLTQQLGVEPEELGQRYLKELIFRGLVDLVNKEDEEDAVQSVAIRDQIHRFFRWEAQRTGFMETHYGGYAAVPDSARRLALNSRNLPKLDTMKVLKKLRTLLSHDDGHNHLHDAQEPQSFKEIFPKLLMHSTFLRVISLEGIDIGEELPREIRNMLHLQYLGIRCPTLTTLPASIRKLKKLQIMDVRGTKVTTLPDSFWKMKSEPRVICDKDLGCPNGAEHRMLIIITPATSSSKHI